MIYLKNAYIKDCDFIKGDPETMRYPFNVAAVRFMEKIVFNKPVTFIIGDNGTGKSTYTESIMLKYEKHVKRGHSMADFSMNDYLPNFMEITENKKPDDCFFFRAETFYNLAAELDKKAFKNEFDYGRAYALENFGGRYLLQQSHGESFINTFLNYNDSNTLYILDEPEAALSPQRQLVLLKRIHELEQNGCQLIICTHSPILISYPGADIYTIERDSVYLTPYKETEIYRFVKFFINNPEELNNELYGDILK